MMTRDTRSLYSAVVALSLCAGICMLYVMSEAREWDLYELPGYDRHMGDDTLYYSLTAQAGGRTTS